MKEYIQEYIKLIRIAWKELKTPVSRRKQIPNILTSLRLLSPFIIIPMVATGNLLAAGVSTLLFSTTDLLDGFLARKLKLTSKLGKDLDAVTDKIFVGTLITSLLITNVIYIVPLMLEIVIAGINIHKKLNNQKTHSSMIGKIKTTSMYVLIVIGFINMYIPISNILINLLYETTIGLQALTIHGYCKEESKTSHITNIEDKIEIPHKEEQTEEKTTKQLQIQKYKAYKTLLEQHQRLEQLNVINEETKIKKLKK